jgi:hypothetical protein
MQDHLQNRSRIAEDFAFQFGEQNMMNMKSTHPKLSADLRGAMSRAVLLALAACLGAAPAFATGGLSIGLGGLGEVSVGRDSLADVDVDVGGLDVEAEVLDRDSIASGCVGACDGPGTSIGVSVGSGGMTASVGSSGGTPGGGTTGTPGAPSPGASAVALSASSTQPVRRQALACAGEGNSSVYDGYALVDRNGLLIGRVHDTRLSPDLKIAALRVRTASNRCIGLEGGRYKVLADGRVWVDMDGARFR